MFHTSLEYRFRALALFLDAGSVWDAGTPKRVRFSTGVSFSPGPVFFTLGFPINTDEFRAVFTMGFRFAGSRSTRDQEELIVQPDRDGSRWRSHSIGMSARGTLHAQTITRAAASGDALAVQAPGLALHQRRTAVRLKDGRAVRVDLELSRAAGPGRRRRGAQAGRRSS